MGITQIFCLPVGFMSLTCMFQTFVKIGWLKRKKGSTYGIGGNIEFQRKIANFGFFVMKPSLMEISI